MKNTNRKTINKIMFDEDKLKAFVSLDIVRGVITTPERQKLYFPDFEEEVDKQWSGKSVFDVFMGEFGVKKKEVVVNVSFLKKMLKHIKSKDAQIRIIVSGEDYPLILHTKDDMIAIGGVRESEV